VRFGYTFVEPNVRQLDYIRELIESGRFKANVSQIFSLDQAARAQGSRSRPGIHGGSWFCGFRRLGLTSI